MSTPPSRPRAEDFSSDLSQDVLRASRKIAGCLIVVTIRGLDTNNSPPAISMLAHLARLSLSYEGKQQLDLFESQPVTEKVNEAASDVASELKVNTGAVSDFVRAACRVAPGAWVRCSDLWAAYVDWCASLGLMPATRISFGRELRGSKIRKSRSRREGRRQMRTWEGISIVAPGQEVIS